MLSAGSELLTFHKMLLRSCLILDTSQLCLQVRETETMDARWLDYPASGDLPDDEDISEFRPHLTSDVLDIDEASGSGGKGGEGKWIFLS